MDNWNKIFKPIVVLACICIAVTTALALTNQATAPIIAQLAAEAADSARKELMPNAPGFEEIPVDIANVQDVYKASDDSGYIITATAKGYGGSMLIMVAYDDSGSIIRIKVQSHAETKGIGDKVEVESFWGQYSGIEATELGLGVEIDKVSGATISSRAVNNAVNSATVAYHAVSSGVTSVPKEEEPTGTPEEILFSKMDLDFADFTSFKLEESHVDDAYVQEDGEVFVIVTKAKGYIDDITAAFAFNNEGEILKVRIVDADEKEAGGELVADTTFLAQYEGIDKALGEDDIDLLSGATMTSVAMNEVVRFALEAFALIDDDLILVEKEDKDEEQEEEVDEGDTEEELSTIRGEWRAEMLPSVEEFLEISVKDLKTENVLEVFQGDEDYYVVTAYGQGYYDLVPVFVVLDMDGAVVQVKQFDLDPHVSKVDFYANDEFFGQFNGETVEFPEEDLDIVSGATVSSTAVLEAVNVAFAVYEEISGDSAEATETEESEEVEEDDSEITDEDENEEDTDSEESEEDEE